MNILIGLYSSPFAISGSETPQPSAKLGRIIRASENPEDSSSVPTRGMMLLSILAMLLAYVMTC